MNTLFQLYSDIGTLKNGLRELSQVWQKNDSVLLLANTTAYIDWIVAYLPEITTNQEIAKSINWYALKTDVKQLSPASNQNIDVDCLPVQLLSDDQWVKLTQQARKVVTVNF